MNKGEAKEKKCNEREKKDAVLIVYIYLQIVISLSIFYLNEQQLTIAIVVVGLIKVLLFPVYSTQLVIANR
jgi:hypothetical protein